MATVTLAKYTFDNSKNLLPTVTPGTINFTINDTINGENIDNRN